MKPAYFLMPQLSLLDASRQLHPFTKTRSLLDHIRPAKDPVSLTIGEPQNQPPAFVAEVIAKHSDGFNKYPPNQGSDELLNAHANWIGKRYAVPELALTPQVHTLASAGSREGLTMAIRAAVAEKRAKGVTEPKVMIPNPFYHTYAGATLSAGAQPIAVNAEADTGFLPDYLAVPDELWDQSAALVLCSPTNPQGSAAPGSFQLALVQKARQHGVLTIFDDCYAEIYRETPPEGILPLLDGDLSQILILHSLSKRSSAAGLRCGFLSGDPFWIEQVAAVMKFTGAAIASPLQAAACALIADEAHVVANRQRYNEAFKVAEQVFDCPMPEAGFFLWLPVRHAQEACVQLWQQEGIRVLPGDSLAWGQDGVNPGSQYLRLALVIEPNLLPRLLGRVADCLKNQLR